jgi:hypothetical protein
MDRDGAEFFAFRIPPREIPAGRSATQAIPALPASRIGYHLRTIPYFTMYFSLISEHDRWKPFPWRSGGPHFRANFGDIFNGLYGIKDAEQEGFSKVHTCELLGLSNFRCRSWTNMTGVSFTI